MDALEKLKDLAVSETGFVFDPYTGSSFNTNGTGRWILDGLKRGLDRPGIVRGLRDEFEVVEEEDLERDLDEFLFLLRENGVLPSDFKL